MAKGKDTMETAGKHWGSGLLKLRKKEFATPGLNKLFAKWTLPWLNNNLSLSIWYYIKNYIKKLL